MARTLSLKAISEALAVELQRPTASLKAQIAAWVRSRPDFLCDRTPGALRFDLDEVRVWIRDNAARKEAVAQVSAIAPAAPPALPTEGDAETRGLADVLSGQASALEVTRAAMQLAARQVARQARSGGAISAMQLDALKKQLEEMRRAEEAYIDLALRRGELLDATVVAGVAGEMASRLNKCMDRMINSAAVQIEIWRADPAFAVLDTEQRARAVREWMENTAREIRNLEADEIKRMLAAGREESEAAT